MTDSPGGFIFSGHETFPFRYPWLKKGYDAIKADRNVFTRDDATTLLGVGKNMVRSIRHWCLAAGIIAEARDADGKRLSSLRATEFGDRLFDEHGLDPYLEHPATLWLIHWHIATNRSRASTWFWIYSHFNEPTFNLDRLTACVYKWAQTLPGKSVAESSVRRDVECFLHTYVPPRYHRGPLPEETLDCPLVDLGLIQSESDGKTYHFRRGPQESLPDGVLLYAIYQFWGSRPSASAETLAISDIASQPGSPGRLFKIDESSLIGRLEQAGHLTHGVLSYDETAGLRQLYRRSGLLSLDPFESLESAYASTNSRCGGTRR
jgi:hypothetical protein